MRTLHLAALLVVSALIARTATVVVESTLWKPPTREERGSTPSDRATATRPVDEARLATILRLEPQPTTEPALAELPITLLGTLAPTHACVFDRAAGAVHTVAVGDLIAGVEVVAVDHRALLVRRAGRLERLPMGEPSAASPLLPHPSDSAPPVARVARSEVAQALQDFAAIAPKLHIVPRFVDGRLEGFRLLGASQIPLLGRAGLRDGDVIRRINGIDATRPDQLFPLLGQLASLRRVDLELVREGALVHHTVGLE
jgi:type II secretion system protein C